MLKIYHIHIRKTAGTVVYNLLSKQFSQNDVCPIRSEIELRGKFPPRQRLPEITRYRLISGHFYTFGSALSPEYKMITFLRDPLTRAVSTFNHIQNDIRDPFHKKIKGMPISEALQSNLAALELNNGQTRFLVGNAGHDHTQLDDQSAVDIAKSFLDQMFFVGIQEQIESSLQGLAQQFSIDVPDQIPRLNTQITELGIKVGDLSAAELALLQEHNKHDLEIYSYARQQYGHLLNLSKEATESG